MADNRRMILMSWDGLEVEMADDEFFESKDRISSAAPINLASSGSDDDEDYDDGRISFASAATSAPPEEFCSFVSASSEDYNLWMEAPGPIKDRRQRLLRDMGLSQDLGDAASNALTRQDPKKKLPPLRANTLVRRKLIVRSKSESSIVAGYVDAKFREEMCTNTMSKKRLLRLLSLPSLKPDRNSQLRTRSFRPCRTKTRTRSRDGTNGRTLTADNGLGGMFLIKNLDTGKVFLMNEGGTTSSLSDLQTGKQLTMEEFEKSVEHSPIVKELMRRENVGRVPADVLGESERKIMNATLTKSFKSNKKKGAAWLRNIKGVANSINGLIADRDKEHNPPSPHQSNTSPSKWTKVHQHGKSYKEITGLYMCQEIQAHEGSIWSIKFSPDAQYLASAGEDRVIHIWEVVDCDVYNGSPLEEANSTPCHPLAKSPSDRPPLADSKMFSSERKKRGMLSYSSKKNRGIPGYVSVPETVFSLSDKPICSFEGHLDDVLDLSWSKSKQLLSSSMDKTVRLWDLESKTCLKLFAHNDYVTCIQFNPIDDRYFISGSLDAKVRIWNIPERKVVDWTDLHEMVTAVCYTPDGQGALVGSHKGSCRLYKTSGCKLIPKGRFDVKVKRKIDVKTKNKSRAKKITGFQFAPGNPSEVLITSADSRIRIFDGSDIAYKFRGFRNTSSQISASFSTDGRYIVSASEDSQVYIWKHDEIHHASGGKNKGLITTHSYERFQCKDVSVAIPWPGTLKYDPPTLTGHSKRHSKRINIHIPASPRLSVPDVLFRTPSITKIFPPLPKRNSITDRGPSCPEEDISHVSRTNSGIGESSNSLLPPGTSNSFAYGDHRSVSASDSSHPSLSWLFDSSNSSGRNNIRPAAWGLVVVTAGLGGELRVYQNFGMPVRVGRQANLFASASVGSSTSKRFL